MYKTGLAYGRRNRLSFDYYIPSSNSNIDGFSTSLGNAGPSVSEHSATLDAWTSYSNEGVCDPANGSIYFYATDGGNSSFTDAGGDDVLYIRNVTITQVGTLADLRASRYDESTGKLYDASSNAFVGVNYGSISLVGNALPIYETGTWTPTLAFGGGSAGMTYTSQEGFYTRIGNTVFCTGGFVLNAVGSSTGAATIALPYTSRNTTNDIQGVSVGRGLALSGLTSAVSGYIVDNTTTCQLMDWGATGAVNLLDTNFTGSTEINISATYQIS